MFLVDTHSHLQADALFPHLDRIVEGAAKVGVMQIVCCGGSESDWPRVREAAFRHSGILPFFGVHPFHVTSVSKGWEEALASCLLSTPSGVGEIGLDGMIDWSPMKLQEEVFTAQIRMARRLERPVSIHCRKAWDRMLKILKAEGGLPFGGAFHAWSGSRELVREMEKLNGFVSFSGAITKTANKKVARSARAVSTHRLLMETDAPDILPVGAPEGPNLPEYLPFVLDALSRCRKEPSHMLAEILHGNSRRFLEPISRL